MSWAEIKKAINSDLSKPLNELIDSGVLGVDGHRYLPVFESLSKIAESDDYGGAIYALALDDDYIYGCGATTQKVYKLGNNLYTLIGYRRVE